MPIDLEEDLRQIVNRDFAAAERPFVLQQLQSIGLHHVMAASAYNLRNTRFAVLKLAKGSLAVVKSMTERAKEDFRDVIMWAGEES